MKKLLLILTTTLSLFASEYAVQVMALKKPSSLQPSLVTLLKKQEQDGAKLQIIHEGIWQKLQFRTFTTACDAYAFCKKMQKNFTGDSFVIKIIHPVEHVKKVQKVKKYIKHHYDEDFNNPYADDVTLEEVSTQKAHTNFYTFYMKECSLKEH